MQHRVDHILVPTLRLRSKTSSPRKFYSKYIIHVTYTNVYYIRNVYYIAHRAKSSSERKFWNIA